jgi:hypothetical protein
MARGAHAELARGLERDLREAGAERMRIAVEGRPRAHRLRARARDRAEASAPTMPRG